MLVKQVCFGRGDVALAVVGTYYFRPNSLALGAHVAIAGYVVAEHCRRQALETWLGHQQEQAGCVISAVGSLSMAQPRFAGASEATTIQGELEILSLSGTLSPYGLHLHIAIAESNGAVIGGHLCPGSLVRTTAELVLGLLPEWQFRRERDPATGYAELAIKAQPER